MENAVVKFNNLFIRFCTAQMQQDIANAARALYKISNHFRSEIATIIAEEISSKFAAYATKALTNASTRLETSYEIFEEAQNHYDIFIKEFVIEMVMEALKTK